MSRFNVNPSTVQLYYNHVKADCRWTAKFRVLCHFIYCSTLLQGLRLAHKNFKAD